MLDKLKIFNTKDKIERAKAGNISVSKRTSSSSGFSSARSEQSDSSTSLCGDASPRVPNTGVLGDKVLSSTTAVGTVEGTSPKSLARGLRNKLVKGANTPKEIKQNSPKSSRRGEPNKPSPKLIQKSGSGNVSVSNLCNNKEQKIEIEKYQNGDKGSAEEFQYQAALELDNPIKQSKISNINGKPELNMAVSKPKKISENSPTVPVRSTGTTPPGSSIPKPMAAIKGTSKPTVMKDERPIPSEPSTPLKEEKQSSSPLKPGSLQGKGFGSGENILPRQKHMGWEDMSSSGSVSVALVSPMPSVASSDCGSKASESSSSTSNTTSTSTGHSNSSDSSVIYQPSSESGSELKDKPSNRKMEHPATVDINRFPAKKIETTFDSLDKITTQEAPKMTAKETSFGEEDDTVMNVKPMQPLLRGYTGGLVMHGRSLGPSLHHPRLGFDNGLKCVNYSQEIGLNRAMDLKRGMADGDYSDIELAAGYMSDSDMVRMSMLSRQLPDLCDGYMSEGGASLYARSHQMLYHDSRFPNSSSESSSREQPPRPPGAKRFDDTSSVSSGLSESAGDFFPEDLPSHQNKRLIQGTRPTGLCTKSQSPPKTVNPPFNSSECPQVVYRVVNSRSQTRKSDSGQQTDYSAFSSQWKKYVETSRVGKGELETVKAREKRALGVSPGSAPSINSPNNSNNGQIRKPDKNLEKHRKMGVKDDVISKEKEYVNGEKQPKTDRSSPHPPVGMRAGGEGKSGKVRGVPQSFGYVKRPTNGTGSSKSEPRTAQVSAVPRTKVKVSGGTQTCTSDLQQQHLQQPQQQQQHHHPQQQQHHPHQQHQHQHHQHQPQPQPQHQSQQPQHHYKSFSLTGPAASQLSQSVRDRLLLGSQSLPKPGSNEYAALFHQHRVGGPPRPIKPTDGSLSDTTYSNYSELHGSSYYGAGSPYSSWLRHSSTYTASLPARTSTAAGLAEADSVESLCSLPAQLQHRASLTHARLLMHQRESSASPVPRLNRSNSIRSTKSEKLYPSMLQRSEELEPYYCVPIGASPSSQNQHASQPTSPTPSQVSQGAPSRFNYPLSPITSSASSHMLGRTGMSAYPGPLSKTNSKDDEIHGSSVSLVSTASSLYSTAEEKQAHEIRKLRRELQEAQEKVLTLTSQLSTNAHVVSAFEQSLSNMTQRLQHLTSTAEKKDSELLELRQTIELLRKQSVEAGLTSAHLQSMSPSLSRRHTINASAALAEGNNISRQLSADSVSSINSLSSACSLSSSAHAHDGSSHKKKKKGWLRSSFSKAFSRSKKNKNGSVSDVEDSRGLNSDVSAPSSPLLNEPHQMNGNNGIKSSQSSSAICGAKDENDGSDNEAVEELKKQLREKDLVLTDIRLEALSSAHQLESLKDTVIKMRNEMLNLKQDNERLQRIVTSKSLTSSQSSLPVTDSLERRFSLTETHTIAPPADPDGKRVPVSVFLGSHGSYRKYMEDGTPTECVISAVSISSKTKWDMLDCMVRRVFKEYVLRVDPVSNLGLSADSLWSYHIGEVVRYKDSDMPELLPYGYLVGNAKNIHVCLKGALHSGSVDALAFETLIPKSIVQRYVSLLTEHRRIILCGPSGTGKSYLANKLAEFLVLREGKESTAEAIATFNVDHKSSKELRQYLANVAEQCESNASDLPSVIILDNLHHAASLGEVFNGFLNAKYAKCPYIIGTMNQATCSTTNLQLHHNFRWILCANHMEPVKGFLGRYLRRRLVETEVQEGIRNNDLIRIFDWIPKVWQHLNKFLETHSSSDVTIGPRLFLSCPSDTAGSQVWFTDLWNYSVVPYLMEAVREGLQLYGRRAPWEDPAAFICQTYPWTGEIVQGGQDALLRLRPEDVGYDIQQSSGIGGSSIKSMSSAQSDSEGDPLLNMLMRLQEAASYSSPHSNDSDSISLDSHASSIHNDEKSSSRVESTL